MATTDGSGWYYAEGQNPIGPMTLEELARHVGRPGGPRERAMVFGPGLGSWTEARHVQGVMEALGASPSAGGPLAATPPPLSASAAGAAGRGRADEIDYEIYGSEMQYVEVTLDPGETVVAEAGAMMYMTPGVQMETVFGDPSAQQSGLMGKLVGAGKRLLTGESLFMTTFTAAGRGREQIAFAAPYPGKIVPMDLRQLGGELICQKDAFVCAAKGVQVGIAFQKKIGVGLFGGEGFIMQRLTGDGVAMVHAGGTLMTRDLAAGEVLKVDTGCLVGMLPSVQYDIQMIGGIKNKVFGGEGLFFATLTGPGRIWLQSLPFSRMAGRVVAAAGAAGGKEEGSVLGGIGNLLGGDR